MLQQQLMQRDEDLTARKAEIGELKERVAALEKLKQQQDQLLTMKDSELAAAQQRLADARTAANTPPAATVTATPAVAQVAQGTQPVPEPQAKTPHMLPWLWSGLAVLGLGLLVWLLMRRRRAPLAPAPRRSVDSDAMAASLRAPATAAAATPAAGESFVNVQTPATSDGEQVIDIADIPATLAPRLETPTWHSGRWVKTDAEPAAPVPGAPRFVPPEEDPLALGPQVTVPPSAEQRIRLARAFIDIGDEHSARQLLRELVVDPDPGARAEAANLLREID